MSTSCKSASLLSKRAKAPKTHFRDGMTDAEFRRLFRQRANDWLKVHGGAGVTGQRMFDRPFGKASE